MASFEFRTIAADLKNFSPTGINDYGDVIGNIDATDRSYTSGWYRDGYIINSDGAEFELPQAFQPISVSWSAVIQPSGPYNAIDNSDRVYGGNDYVGHAVAPILGSGIIYSSNNYSFIDFPSETANRLELTDILSTNSQGVLAGTYCDFSEGPVYGFVYDGHSFTQIVDPDADERNGWGTSVTGINDAGVLVGNYVNEKSGFIRGFIYQNGQFIDVIDPNSKSNEYITGINNFGEIVGNYFDSHGVEYGFFEKNGVFRTISAPLASENYSYERTVVTGINNLGEITGYYWNDFGTTTAFVAQSSVQSDFSASGYSDVLFRNTAGTTYLWTMNGGAVTSAATTSVQVGNNWQIAGIGDFNGDGTADILWVYDNTSNASDALNGVSYVSLQSGATALSGSAVVEQLSTNWRVSGVGDFNGDGMSDVLYRNAVTGQTYLNIMNGTSINWNDSGFTSQQVTNLNWKIVATDDFNGDGKTDVLWQYNNASNASDALNGTLYEWQMNGTTVQSAGLLSQQASANWTVAGTGDFDGDGHSDILFRYENASNASDPLNGVTYIDFMNGSTVTSGAPTQWQIDNSWVVASIGDFNGDGKSDILWQQSTTGKTYVWEMNGASVVAGVSTSQQAGNGWTVQNGVHIG